jgi:hypothetical protein
MPAPAAARFGLPPVGLRLGRRILLRCAAGSLVRVCADLRGRESGLAGARVLVVADVPQRVVEDIHDAQALLAAVADRGEHAVLRTCDRLTVRRPSALAGSVGEAAGLLGAPADVVLGAMSGPSFVRVGPVNGAPAVIDSLALRLALLGRRYYEPLDLTAAQLAQAAETLRVWRMKVREWAQQPSAAMPAQTVARARAAFDDDLDVPVVLDIMHRLADDAAVAPGAKFETFVYLDRVLALDLARDLGT